MKTEIVRIRLKPSTYLKYENAARLNQMPLSTFLRAKLEEAENTVSEISALKSAIYDLRLNGIDKPVTQENKTQDVTEHKLSPDPMLTEIVLLLRGIVRPDHMNMVHGELRRQGFDVFSIVD